MSALAFQIASTPDRRSSRFQRVTAALCALPLLAFLIWVSAYALGLAPWLGFASQTETFVGQREAPSGVSVGPRTFAFVRGQRIFVSYDLTRADAGALKVRVIRRGDLTPDPRATLTLDRSETGRHEYVVPASGLYTVSLRCAPDDQGCDIAYRASWGGLPKTEGWRVAALDAAEPGTWNPVGLTR